MARAFRHRDFRILWAGAFLSFVGSWIQTVGQGWLVFEMTGDKGKLALVAFCGMAPVSLIGPFAGALVDTMNKRALLIGCQVALSATALFLALATYVGFVEYWHIVMVALIVGFVGALEMPTRQSIVSRVVPQEDLAAAIPLNALTFNLARLAGPAIGGIVLAGIGVEACYLINGISYIALVFSAMAIRSDLRATAREPQPIQDLVLEGMRYTFSDRTLRTLFLLESAVSVFGIFFISLMPAIAKETLGLNKQGLGFCYTAMGIGSVFALLVMAASSERPIRALVLRLDMTFMALALLALAFTTYAPLAFFLFAVLGLCAVAHFNTTNTLFQLLSPDRLRGRVLSMHVWALSGLNPIGVIFFGWLAEQTSLQWTIMLAAFFMLVSAGFAWGSNRGLAAAV